MTKPKIVITGGGTAGHTNPGIAIAQALVERGIARSDIHFVGGVRGNESTLVPEAGFTIDLLPGRGIQRKISFQNVVSIANLLRGFLRGFFLTLRRRPKVVVSLGGYAAFAVSLSAVVLRVPLVVSEQNARASKVNRIFGKRAAACALPFPTTDLPNGTLTGNPIRLDVLHAVEGAERTTARSGFGVTEGKTMLAIWSGSLGAAKVNKVVRQLATRWSTRDDVSIYHVVGKRDWPDFETVPDEILNGQLEYKAVEYENGMPSLLVAADLAVCRSGASTIAEISVAGLPAVLVPLPNAPRDHQVANTEELLEANGAVLLTDGELTVDSLEAALIPIIEDSDRRQTMSDRARSVGRPSAATAVAELVLQTGKVES